MKKSFLTICGLALAAALVTPAYAQGVNGKAVIKYVSGTATCINADKTTQPAKQGMQLDIGTTIQTGIKDNCYVDLAVNDSVGAVRIMPSSTVAIEKMVLVGGPQGDSETCINVKMGTVLGSVKKLSKASRFDIKASPIGLAGIRGTDFGIIVKQVKNNPKSQWEVTFMCIKGEVVAAGQLPGDAEPTTNVLYDNDQWTFPGVDITKFDPAGWERTIGLLDNNVNPPPTQPTPPGGGHGDQPPQPPYTPPSQSQPYH